MSEFDKRMRRQATLKERPKMSVKQAMELLGPEYVEQIVAEGQSALRKTVTRAFVSVDPRDRRRAARITGSRVCQMKNKFSASHEDEQ